MNSMLPGHQYHNQANDRPTNERRGSSETDTVGGGSTLESAYPWLLAHLSGSTSTPSPTTIQSPFDYVSTFLNDSPMPFPEGGLLDNPNLNLGNIHKINNTNHSNNNNDGRNGSNTNGDYRVYSPKSVTNPYESQGTSQSAVTVAPMSIPSGGSGSGWNMWDMSTGEIPIDQISITIPPPPPASAPVAGPSSVPRPPPSASIGTQSPLNLSHSQPPSFPVYPNFDLAAQFRNSVGGGRLSMGSQGSIAGPSTGLGSGLEKRASKKREREGGRPPIGHTHRPASGGGSGNKEDELSPKRRSKSKVQPREIMEIRSRRFRDRVPKTIKEKVPKIMAQRRFLVDRVIIDGVNEAQEFKVRGNKGEATHTVSIDNEPRCDCADFEKGVSPCEHLIFVFLKVLKIPEQSYLWFQKGLLSHELKDIFENTRNPTELPPSLAAAARKANAASGGVKEEAPDLGLDSPLSLLIGTDCQICYDVFTADDITHERLRYDEQSERIAHQVCLDEAADKGSSGAS